MIQRIQTVYLFLALVLVLLTSWLPLGEIASGNTIFLFTTKGISNTASGELIMNGWPLWVMATIIALLHLVIIFRYKKRIQQMRMTTFSILLLIGFAVLNIFFMRSAVGRLPEAASVYKLPLCFPLVAIIFDYLAIKAIGRDEALVRSVDRIR